jgi:ribosomal protein S7
MIQLVKRYDGTSRDKKKLVQVFIGSMVKNGKRVKAMSIFNVFLINIRVKYEVPPLDFLESLIEVIRPKVFLVSKKISGSTVRIPAPISIHHSYAIAVRWFLSSAYKRRGSTLSQLITYEAIDIYSNPTNATIRKRDEYHKLAKLNRPFLRHNKF